MKLSEVFNVFQGHQITDKEIYYSTGEVPIYTGDNEIKGYWNKSFGKDIILPCLSYPVKGFQGVISVREHIFDANNTAVLCLKEEYRDQVELEWFKFILPHYFYQKLTNKEGVSYLSKDAVEDIDIHLINKEEQTRQLKVLKRLDVMYEYLTTYKEKVDQYLNKQIILRDEAEEWIPLNEILSYVSRNDSLSESGLYQRSADTDERIAVLSGAADAEIFGWIDASYQDIHYLAERQALHLVTRGKAGKMNFLEKGTYATNTNAFLIYIPYENWERLNIKNEASEKIYLKYLKCYLQNSFFHVSSSADVSVFPLTEVMEDMMIPFFKYNDKMKEVVHCIERLEKMQKYIQEQLSKVIKLKRYYIM